VVKKGDYSKKRQEKKLHATKNRPKAVFCIGSVPRGTSRGPEAVRLSADAP